MSEWSDFERHWGGTCFMPTFSDKRLVGSWCTIFKNVFQNFRCVLLILYESEYLRRSILLLRNSLICLLSILKMGYSMGLDFANCCHSVPSISLDLIYACMVLGDRNFGSIETPSQKQTFHYLRQESWFRKMWGKTFMNYDEYQDVFMFQFLSLSDFSPLRF